MERPRLQGQDCDESKMCSIKGFVKIADPETRGPRDAGGPDPRP
jgi:hypothetical protein